ncbi:hypothetical protein ACFY19_07095 [Streptosporangium saharense]|uniref:Uncharacterized protein n=1 Tax=Streptosporangium saharense TaxID=1706840 RepID=A0A7W7QL85_9ACTN|nr:hypothetical protein [Streptosporangium saharense]MBB4915621.1 hypothetical protein [Streptosporangium saharense]
MARHVPAWIMAVVTAFLLTNIVVAPDGDRRTAPPSAVSAFMTITASGGTARAVRASAAPSAASAVVPAAASRAPGREAEPNPDQGGTEPSARGCRNQAPARWSGGTCPQCLSPHGRRHPCAATASTLPATGASASATASRPGAGRREAAVAAPSQARLQVFRC